MRGSMINRDDFERDQASMLSSGKAPELMNPNLTKDPSMTREPELP